MDHPWVSRTLPTIDTLLPNNQSSPTSEDLKRTFAVSLHSDTSASHSLPSQQAWELSSQKQHAKDWSYSHCEFQSVTSVVCFSSWLVFHIPLRSDWLVKENWGAWEQLAAGGGVRNGGGWVWRTHVVEEWCCSPSEIIVTMLYNRAWLGCNKD